MRWYFKNCSVCKKQCVSPVHLLIPVTGDFFKTTLSLQREDQSLILTLLVKTSESLLDVPFIPNIDKPVTFTSVQLFWKLGF